MREIQDCIAKYLSPDTNDEYEIIQYGVERIVFTLLYCLTICVLGLMWEELPTAILILLTTQLIRPYAGGYHADTKLGCISVTLLIYNIIFATLRFIQLRNGVFTTLVVISAVVIIVTAPVGNDVHALDIGERRIYRKKANGYTAIALVLFITSKYFVWEALCHGIGFGLLAIAVLNCMGVIKYRKKITLR